MFTKEHSASKSKYSEDDIIKKIEFLVVNVFVVEAGKVFKQVSSLTRTNCVPILGNIYLFFFVVEFIQTLFLT